MNLTSAFSIKRSFTNVCFPAKADIHWYQKADSSWLNTDTHTQPLIHFLAIIRPIGIAEVAAGDGALKT